MSSTTLTRSRPNLPAMAVGALVPTLGWLVSAARSRQREADARKDGLTGVLTRAEFEITAQQFLNRHRDNAVFCFIDVDHFKKINDTHGHAAGDAVLVELARRMKKWTGERAGLIARYGDEFVLVARIHPSRRAVRLPHLADVLSRPVTVDGRDLDVSASIGVAEPTTLGTHDLSLLQRGADVALYKAKDAGQHSGALRFATVEDPEAPSRNGRRIGRPGTHLEVVAAA